MKKVLILVILLLLGILAYVLWRDNRPVAYVSPEAPTTNGQAISSTPDTKAIFEGEEDKVITEDTQYIKVNVHYPVFTNKAITDSIKRVVEEEIATFKADANIQGLSQTDKDFQFQNGSKYEITITYKVYPSTTISTVMLSIATYTGGAHGSLVLRSLNFDRAGTMVFIGDIFQPESDYLKVLSDVSRLKLKAQLGETLGAWSDDGTAPTNDNFSTFYITDPHTLHIIFQPYQVAPWVAGAPDVSFDMTTDLSSVINQDVVSH
jgi:hypothetical protein